MASKLLVPTTKEFYYYVVVDRLELKLPWVPLKLGANLLSICIAARGL